MVSGGRGSSSEYNLGTLALAREELDNARDMFTRALATFKEIADPGGLRDHQPQPRHA
jgi:hypothetical protein